MKSRSLILAAIFCLCTTLFYAQNSIDGYKYVIVPKQYNFQKSQDQYQLNALVKFLFDKEGFQTVFSTEAKAQDLAVNPCLALTAMVKNNSNMFTTKVVLELLNCHNEVVFTSEEGKSKIKEYKRGYQEAIRNAFQSVVALDYSYNPSKSVSPNVVVEKEEKPIEITEVVAPVIVKEVSNEAKEETLLEIKEEVIPPVIDVVEASTEDTNLLYAQANKLGYQLVDSTPSVVFILLKSTNTNLYFLKNKNGVVYKVNEKWYAEFYTNDKLVKQELHIKF
tara:strand:- start:49729 stop:50562 length:834 start_codon:yes stop_codon:yes gene_type:complete